MSTSTSDVPTAVPPPDARPAASVGWRGRAVDLAGRFAMIGVLILLVIGARIAYSGFFQLDNIRALLVNDTPTGLVAVGMTFVLIGGGFDLSVGSIFALAGVAYATLANSMPVGIAFALMLPLGILMGVANGLVITRLKVNAFVATLGSASIFSGIAYEINTSGAVIVTKTSFQYLGTASWLGVPAMIWILGIVFLVGGLVLSKTVYGRAVYIVGGNAEAARLAGMRVGFIQASTYAITAVTAVLAGMLLASQTGAGQANVGASLTLDSIAVVIIGGTSLRGGQGAMWRTLVGFLIIASIDDLFNTLAWNSAVQSIAEGVIVILAVTIDVWTQRRSGA